MRIANRLVFFTPVPLHENPTTVTAQPANKYATPASAPRTLAREIERKQLVPPQLLGNHAVNLGLHKDRLPRVGPRFGASTRSGRDFGPCADHRGKNDDGTQDPNPCRGHSHISLLPSISSSGAPARACGGNPSSQSSGRSCACHVPLCALGSDPLTSRFPWALGSGPGHSSSPCRPCVRLSSSRPVDASTPGARPTSLLAFTDAPRGEAAANTTDASASGSVRSERARL